MEKAAISDNPVMRLFPRPLIHYALLAALFAGGLTLLGGCGSIEWPPPEYGPADINTPLRGPASSSAFTGASAVVAGRGDTVYGISRRHRVPMRAIIEANGLRPPFHLKTGQRVKLPRGRQHVVARGETLYGIARRYRANPYALARANGLRPPYAIQAGQRLVLSGGPASPPPSAVKRG